MAIQFMKREIKSSPLITIVFILFIALNIFLISIAGMIGFNLFHSIDYQMDLAKTPHYLQMHQGAIDKDRLINFAKENEYVESYEISEFLNLENDQLSIGNLSLKDSLQDNGIVSQNEFFDFLLNLDNKVIHPKKGEVYLPLMFLKKDDIKIGDSMKIGDYELKVAGFLRDSQMNSPLASSKRFLVHKEDFNQLKNQGTLEYLIEFRLHELDDLNQFENDYKEAHLESNGPTVTYPLFRMINAITEGILIASLFLASIILLMISFLSIKFTLFAKMEESYEQIGVLKAIGMRDQRIKRLYFAFYYFVCLIGSLLGILLSLIIAPIFLKPMLVRTGLALAFSKRILISILSAFIISMILFLYVNHILNKLKKVSPIQALEGQREADKEGSLPASKASSLLRGKKENDNFKLALKAFLSTKSLNISMGLILILIIFLMILPMSLFGTIKDASFATYMGMGPSDILVEQRNRGASPEAYIDFLEKNKEIESFAHYRTKNYKLQTKEGQKLDMKLSYGDHSKFPPKYLKGSFPSKKNELALSYLYADELGLKLGDRLELAGENRELILSGIYSDITDGGKTGKILIDDSRPAVKHSFLIKLKDDAKTDEMIAELMKISAAAKVSSISSYFDQFFADLITKLKIASLSSLGISIFLACFISLLFMKLLISQEEYDIAIMKSIGFPEKKIQSQYLIRFALIFIPAALIGILLSKILGEPLVSLLFSSFGIIKIEFISKVFIFFFICPILLAVVIYFSVKSILYTTKDVKIVKYLRG